MPYESFRKHTPIPLIMLFLYLFLSIQFWNIFRKTKRGRLDSLPGAFLSSVCLQPTPWPIGLISEESNYNIQIYLSWLFNALHTISGYTNHTYRNTDTKDSSMNCLFTAFLWNLAVHSHFAGVYVVGPSPSWNESPGSVIRSDGKALYKMFCIIAYQRQNRHLQILWVTNHPQLPLYCPPKSSPASDTERKKKSLICLI